MKIDFELLEKMADAGASAHSIIVMLKAADTKRAPKRTKDKAAKAAAAKAKREAKESENARTDTKDGETERKPTKPSDPNRARIFSLRPRLVALGITESRAGEVLGSYCKLTHDNAGAIETAVAGAELKQPADPIGYIRAVLQDRSSINGKRDATMDAFDRIIAGTGGEVAGDPPMRDITPRGS